jgi:adenine-specific DNA glycosylase
LEILGDAPLDDVLAAWSGLGYYRRAKNLHATAQLTKNGLPKSVKELKKLPGIGEYTASAICCFGLEQNLPVVDTNIARVIKRYFALLNTPEKTVWEKAEKFVNTKAPRAHNLALMDLGSMVCTPKNPNCQECPLQQACQGKEDAQLYTQTKKKEYIAMELFFGILQKDGKIALELSSDNMYKDMLVLPRVEPIEEHFLGSFKHSYTKYKLDVKLYKVEALEGDFTFLSPEEFSSAPISSLTKKAQKFFLS